MRMGKSSALRSLSALAFTITILCLLPVSALAQDPTRFESDIQGFEAVDLVSPPPEDPVLFVGSSSVRGWPDIPGDFPDYPAINRGFGGSQMSDVLYYFDRVVAAYEPALVLVYEGDNDLAGGKSVDMVYEDYLTFVEMVREQLPGTDVVFIATKPSPSRENILEEMRELNERLTALADENSDLWFADVFSPMLDANGDPRAELFGSDMLHMNADGYVLWKDVVTPVIEAWANSGMQTFLVDFGASDLTTAYGPEPNDPVNYWNNVTDEIGSSETGQLLNLVTIENYVTEMGLEIVSPFSPGGPNRSGTAESTQFAANATGDSLYGHIEEWGGATDILPSFRLTGLDVELTYNLTFYASRLGVGDVRETGFAVIGESSTYVTLDPANNIENVVMAGGIIPDPNGQIVVSMEPTENNTNGMHFIYLGALKIEKIPEQAPVVFVQEPADQTAVEYRSATFEAEVDSTPPYTVQWYQDGEAIPDANDFAYTIDIVTPDMNGAAFSVEVSNLLYSATSGQAFLTVIPDTNAPVLVSAESGNGFTIDLIFDELIDPETVTPVENYTVNNGAVEVAAAELGEDGRTVVLTLAESITGSFIVSVNSVQDLAGNEIAADSLVIGDVRLQVFLFDFGSSNTPTGTDGDIVYNDVTQSVGCSDTGALLGLTTVDGVATEAGLVMLSRFNGANESGTQASSLFAASATRDSLFGNTASFGGLDNVFPSFQLIGLDPLVAYDLVFYGSRMGASDVRETGYTVVGANSGFAALNPASNVNDYTMVTEIQPDETGAITVSIAPTENNTNSYKFTYLGVLKVGPSPVEVEGVSSR